ncbi:SDR family oxidoreductase [Kitasatospora sp. NBC_00240]|uniref:NAD(P)-dependent oxidoreductase n=1 Tax=Kitasatospora sp. NBC_00240 TaxID=2903567 RepID=UPI0022552354|nr:SDR family oxidoreductase [Kitasatospora sp. NBC_00240]MCX5211614.1 SDR family oxidoreductase [Kitasatospora sp. NBC_00240]
MRLALFGATGGTGAQLLKQALAAGHQVTAVVRDPARVTRPPGVAPGSTGASNGPDGPDGPDGLTLVRGDVLDPGAWTEALAGQDAVLSCLGSIDRRHPTTVYSQGTRNIVGAMRAAGVGRLLCLSSAGLEIAPGTPLPQRLVTRLVVQRLYRHGYADMARMEALVRESDLAWTIVRPPMLTDGPLGGRYRTAVNGPLADGRSLSRADLADYLLTRVGDRSTWRAVVEISA